MTLRVPMADRKWLKMRDWKSSWLPKIWEEADRVAKAPGWNPKVVPLENSLVMIDLAFRPGKRISLPSEIFVMRYEDHPFLAELNEMPNVPRAVRSIYKKENLLKYERATDYWLFMMDMKRAEASWAEYLKKMGQDR